METANKTSNAPSLITAYMVVVRDAHRHSLAEKYNKTIQPYKKRLQDRMKTNQVGLIKAYVAIQAEYPSIKDRLYLIAACVDLSEIKKS
jgi:hypothetical protein